MLTIDRSVITDTGSALLNSGDPITITSIKTGSGTYTSTEDIKSRTALKNPEYSYTPTAVQVDGANRTVSGMLTNYDPDTSQAIVTADYTITEVGLFATVNSVEVLFAIGISYTGTEVPAFTGQNKSEIIVEWAMALSGTAQITVESAGAYALASDLNTHIDNEVYTNDGVHGIRAVDDGANIKLQIFDGTWKDASSAGKTDSSITPSAASVTFDTSSYSTTITLTVVGDGTVKAFSTDTSLVSCSLSGTTLSLSSHGNGGSVSIVVYMNDTADYNGTMITIPVTCNYYKTYTLRLNLADSNPNTWGTIISGNVTPLQAGGGENEIDDFMGYYPVVLNAGQEYKRISTVNKAKYVDNTSISDSDGDSMVFFPRRGYKISWADSTHLDISITDNPNAPGYEYVTYKGNDILGFYLGMYDGYVSNSKLYSLSGKTVAHTITLGNFRNYAHARGTNYEQLTANQITYLQCCAAIKYMGKNVQIALGRGRVDTTGSTRTGGTNTLGMNYGSTSGTVQCSLFGIEDFYGNVLDSVDGFYINSSFHVLFADGNFSDNGNGYEDIGALGASATYLGYVSKPKATSTKMGFIMAPDGNNGSGTTYFCDNMGISADSHAVFGGSYQMGNGAGIFLMNVNAQSDYAYILTGARLSYFLTE